MHVNLGVVSVGRPKPRWRKAWPRHANPQISFHFFFNSDNCMGLPIHGPIPNSSLIILNWFIETWIDIILWLLNIWPFWWRFLAGCLATRLACRWMPPLLFWFPSSACCLFVVFPATSSIFSPFSPHSLPIFSPFSPRPLFHQRFLFGTGFEAMQIKQQLRAQTAAPVNSTDSQPATAIDWYEIV